MVPRSPHEAVVRPNESVPLAAVPFHRRIAEIVRHASPEDFPVHVAVHEIAGVEDAPREYTLEHSHPAPELNVLIGAPGELVYRIEIDGEVREVSSPASVWIPAGARHASNVVRGRGTFVCVILAPTREAFPDAGP